MNSIRKQIGLWLIVGVIMVFFQIIIGGITRLTGSGLSITKWEIVTGTLPPLTISDWESEFIKYKETPQYEKINKGMSLKEFQFIYFWEYIHRLWARLMGFVFIITFGIFLYQKKISKLLLLKLAFVIIIAAIVASFGWIMVASGLIDKPWVSPFKLTMHLTLALVLFAYLIWLCAEQFLDVIKTSYIARNMKFLVLSFTALMVIQILLGGMMSGLKAGLNFPTFPKMNGEWIPYALKNSSWTLQNFIQYDNSVFAASFVQFFHRLTAYIMFCLAMYLGWKGIRSSKSTVSATIFSSLILIVSLQLFLGIWTVLSCEGQIPVLQGVLHQAGAIILLAVVVLINYIHYHNKPLTV